ncbi:MAG: septum site-determining protein MinC [Clostridia bacterium]
MNDNFKLKITANKNGPILTFSKGAFPHDACALIKEKLESAPNFFANVVCYLKVPLFWSEVDKYDFLKFCEQLGLKANYVVAHTPTQDFNTREAPTKLAVNTQNGDSLFLRTSFRSGQNISHNGNIIILGNVNPGAEIFATKNIIVLGKVKGFLHAGCLGDSNASILAFELYGGKYQIADANPLILPFELQQNKKIYSQDDHLILQDFKF